MTHNAFRQAIEAQDIDAAIARLADDVVFRSPVVYKPYEGRAAVAVLLRAISEVLEDFRYVAEVESGDQAALIFEARVGDREVQGLDFMRLDSDGRIADFTVMLRPMSGLLAVAEAMRAELEAAAGGLSG